MLEFPGAIGFDHGQVEIESPESVEAMLRAARPDVVINTAAFHNTERCEQEPERAFAVNALAVDRLAAACAAAGAALAHVSTDYVFDGASRTPYVESDSTAPLSVYGVSKLAGERLAQNRTERTFIFRTSALYAYRGPSSAKGLPFIERILQQAEAGKPLRVVDDITFSPSYAKHVAHAMREVVERGEYGVYHVTNSGHCTWYEFAAEILAVAGYGSVVERISSASGPATLRRPAFSALAHEHIAALALPPIPEWRAGVQAYIAERRSPVER